jgi:hypothetical protein
MGEVSNGTPVAPKTVQAAVKAVPVVPNGKRIPMDMDIPF